MPAEFVHLHVHSEYSLLDGANRIGKMVDRAKGLGMPALALTDHGNLFGAIDFYRACKKAGIKPILGCELYVAAGNRTDRGPHATKYHHLLALAQNYQGFINLGKLSSIGYTEGFYYKPRIDLEVLAQHADGLVATSACLKGMVPQAVVEGNHRQARDLMGAHLDIFGPDRYFLEVQSHDIPEQGIANRGLVELAKKNNLRLVGTNDAHYLDARDASIHEVLLCISTGKTLADDSRMKFACHDFYIRPPEEMVAQFAEFPDAAKNTLLIADMCNLEIPLGEFKLPSYDPPEGQTMESYLLALVEEGLHARYGEAIPAAVRERVDYELSVIEKAGYTAYFLIVWDFIHYAKSQGIPVGPGRGSAAGSLVAFALGITELDPIEHGLLFERFLNPERVSPPDIDIDFCFERRGEVIEYVRKKYGNDRVAQIITFGTMKAKAAVRDVGRVLGVPLSTVDRVAKLIPDGPKVTLESALEDSQDVRDLLEQDMTVKKLWKLAERVEGSVRHCSVHAAGVIIADRPLTEVVPLYKAPNDETFCTQFPMTTCEEIGLLKMDFLGIKNLTIIERVIRELKRTRNIEIDWSAIDLNDPDTYKLLGQGDTEGVFQLESQGMRKLVRQLEPTEFADITALLALYRPGPLGASMDQMYVERKHGRQSVSYDHPLMEPILKETHGIILYQEQVMNIATSLAGFTMGQADTLRKAMGKKKADLMAKMKAQFIEGAVANQIHATLAEHIWNQMETFAGYGFNKSHSAAYAVITFRTAYLKAHYPTEFMAALLTNEIGNQAAGKMAVYINGCREKGIPILPPDVNQSHAFFTVEPGKGVRFGLSAVRGVGVGAIEELDAERTKGGPFKTFMDFLLRMPSSVLNSRVLEALIRVGAFDSLGLRRSQLDAVLHQALELAVQRQRERAGGQASLFDALDESGELSAEEAGFADEIQFPDTPEWPLKEKLAHEKALLGFYLTGHPLDRYRVDVQSFATCTTTSIAEKKEGENVTWLGMITKLMPRLDKEGNPWVILEAEDFEGTVELKVWPRNYDRIREHLEPDALVAFRGRVNHWRGANQIDVQDVRPIADLRASSCKSILVEWDVSRLNAAVLSAFKSIVDRNRGRRPVELVLRHPDCGLIRFEFEKPLRVNPTDECLDAIQKLDGTPRIRLESA